MNNNFNKGEIIITVRDAKTLQIKNQRTEYNILTDHGFGNMFRLGRYEFDYFFLTGQEESFNRIYLREEPRYEHPLIANFDNKNRNDQTVQEPEFIDADPPFGEVTRRFSAPDSDKEWNVIALGDAQFRESIFAYVSLDTPCVQTTTEVLDVTYRVIFSEAQTDNPLNVVGVSKNYALGLFKRFFADDYSIFPSSMYRMITSFQPASKYKAIPSRTIGGFNSPSTVNLLNEQNSNNIANNYKYRFTWSPDKSDAAGQLIETFQFSDGQYFKNGVEAAAWAPATPDDFPNKPIQPIHNHSKDAIEPFLDVDFLASGSGSLSADGSNWTDPDWAKFYRIDINQDGNIGTSSYSFRKRATVGFSGNSYRPSEESLELKWADVDDEGNPLNATINGVDPLNDHGLSSRINLENYDAETLIMWDDTGIIIQQQHHGEYNVFDADTSPSLQVNNVSQTARDQNGSVYVADRTSGLYRIDNPLSSPTITKITSTDNNIPSGGDSACYGITQGYDGRMWALFDGGLSYSDDSGSSWTNLDSTSTPVFEYQGITDSNWSDVVFIQADRSAPAHELALLRVNGELVWYSLSTETTTAFTGHQFYTHYNSIRCSLTGSVWMGNSTSEDGLRRLKFGTIDTSTEVNVFPFDYLDEFPVSFLYDYYNSPILLSAVRTNRDEPFIGAFHADGNMIAPIWKAGTDHSGAAPAISFEENSPGIFTWEGTSNDRDSFGSRSSGGPLSLIVGATGTSGADVTGSLSTGASLALNHQHTPLEESIWRRYHWNGTSWEQNYFTDATDTASYTDGPFPGQRHNFDTEDHSFTGRALIDGTNAFSSGIFTDPTDATWAFTLTPKSKLNTGDFDHIKDQERPRTIFEVADTSVDHRLSVLWDDGNGDIVIEEDIDNNSTVTHTIDSTPNDDTEYRFVVTLSGTSLDVYLDGSQIGSTITLASGLDFSNSNDSLKFIIGARAYLWNYQRNTMLPGNFYRGTMENIQVWNGQWSSTDISDDANDPSGVISSSNGDLIVRYELTEDLSGTESKTTHSDEQDLDEGIQLGFNSGDGTDFIATDYYTFGVVDGILKDNATSFTYQYSLYLRPADVEFSEFTDPSGGDTVPSSSTSDVTELAVMIQHSNTNDVSGFPGLVGHFNNEGGDQDKNSNKSVYSVQKITDDGFLEASPSRVQEYSGFGLTSTPGNTENASDIDFGFFFNSDGSVDIMENGSVSQTDITTYDFTTDVYRVQRSGTTIEYVKIEDGTESTLHTSSESSSDTLYGIAYTPTTESSLHNVSINYTQPELSMRVGTSSTETGGYNPDFLRVETEEIETASIQLDGVDATPLTGEDTWWDNMPTPGPGQVVINGASGHMLFNSDDAGKQVTGSVIVVTRT